MQPAILLQFSDARADVRDSLVTERLMATLSGFFGVLAMLIATIGLYGVMSYMVARRRTEIGIRMALGADRAAVVRMIVGEAATLLAAGLCVGAGLAIAGGQFAATLLFGLKPWDPATLALLRPAWGWSRSWPAGFPRNAPPAGADHGAQGGVGHPGRGRAPAGRSINMLPCWG